MLVATDGSPNAIRAADMAARLGQELRKAEVVLVNVGHIPTLALGSPGPDGLVDLGGLVEGLERAGLAILDRTAQAFARSEIPVTRVYRQGEPAAEISRYPTRLERISSLSEAAAWGWSAGSSSEA